MSDRASNDGCMIHSLDFCIQCSFYLVTIDYDFLADAVETHALPCGGDSVTYAFFVFLACALRASVHSCRG